MATAFPTNVNKFSTTVTSAGYSPGAGTIPIVSDAGLPSLSGGAFVRFTAVRGTVGPTETVLMHFKATGHTSTSLTGVVAVDGTTDTALVLGDTIECRVSAEALNNVQTALNTAETSVATNTTNIATNTAAIAAKPSPPFAGGSANPLVKDATDATKLAAFDAATIATGTTRTYTLPNGSGTVALASGLAGSQTINGDTASAGNLRIDSTSHATKGSIFFNSASGSAVNSVGKWIGVQQVIAWIGTSSACEIGITGPATEGGVSFGPSNDAKMYRSAARTVRADHNFLIVAQNAADVPGTTRGATSQTGDLYQWQSSTSSVLANVDKNGAIASGNSATGSRPTVSRTGAQWFDTTLGIPIWWNGSNWVNASGTTV